MTNTHQLPAEAFKRACAEQRKIAALLVRLDGMLSDFAEHAYANQRDWGNVGSLVNIREQLKDLLGDED